MIRFRPLARALAASFVLVLACCAGKAYCAGVASGPMAGYSDRDRADIWLMTDGDARVGIDYWPVQKPRRVARSAVVETSAAGGHAAIVRLDGLRPGTRYRYRVRIDGRNALPGVPLGFVTQPADARAPRDFSLATGSCAYLADESARTGSESAAAFGIFDVIAARRPDVMLWLGDTVYFRDADFDGDFDASVPARMNARWASTRTYAPLQRLLRTGQHYGIWDDHEYGPNDADGSFALKPMSNYLFRRYWANGRYGLPGVPGIFSKVSYEDVDLFLLDDRTERDDDDLPDDTPGKTLLGAAQLDWLKRELRHSRASFKLIANGSRMLSDRPNAERRGGEGWHNHPAERREFIEWLTANRIDGVVFVSGDIHYTHMTERAREGGYPLVELTCSPLTSNVHPRPNPVRPVEGTVALERNFCTMDFRGAPAARELVIAAWRADGSRLWQRRYAASDLRSR